MRGCARLSYAVPQNSRPLTLTAPTAIILWETFTFLLRFVGMHHVPIQAKRSICSKSRILLTNSYPWHSTGTELVT